MQDTLPQQRPWYREFYVWMLIFFPALSVVGGGTMLYLSISTYDGLVVDDYYKRGLEINRTLARDQAAAAHGLQAEVELNAAVAHVRLSTAADYALPQSLTLELLHSTRAGFDQHLELEQISPAAYRVKLPANLPEGVWTLRVFSDDWRLQGRIKLPAQAPLHLKPLAYRISDKYFA